MGAMGAISQYAARTIHTAQMMRATQINRHADARISFPTSFSEIKAFSLVPVPQASLATGLLPFSAWLLHIELCVQSLTLSLEWHDACSLTTPRSPNHTQFAASNVARLTQS